MLIRFNVNKNAQSTGEHEVHRASCSWLPQKENCIYLGEFATSQEAIREAKKHYDKVDGCGYCCPESHRT